MKTTIKILAVFVLVLLAFGQHTSALAAYTQNDQGRWINAEATFESVDASGCIYTRVYVLAVEALSELRLEIYQYDTCTSTQLLYAINPNAGLAESDLLISGNLDSATLNTTVPVMDWERNVTFDVNVDLTWTGTSALNHSISNVQSHEPGCHSISHFNNHWRLAEVTGTVSDGQINFIPEPAVYGQIYSPQSFYKSNCEE